MSSGQIIGVYSTNGNSGGVTVSCSNGTLSMTSPTCSMPTTNYNYPVDSAHKNISFNPNNLAVYCQSRGKNAVVANSVAKNRAPDDLPVCGNINSQLQCQAYTNCNNPAWLKDGCFIIETAACTP